jgi:hypothetical protein
LLKYDLQVWKDSKDIPIGGNIPKSIYSGIKDASHFCCIISAASVKSKWVEEELSFAKVRQLGDSGLQIIPVLIDKVEIPDYVVAYRCAHLEDRNLAITNPEFIKVLKAFGTDLEEYSRNLITGKHRILLLESCKTFLSALALFREMLANFQKANIEYHATLSNKAYDPADGLEGIGAPSITRQPTSYGSDYRIREARGHVVGILTPLRVYASRAQESLEVLRKAWSIADATRSVSAILVLLYDPLSRVTYISGTVSNASDDLEKNWWIRDKLSAWLEDLAEAEISIASAITLLESWASFDPV